MRIIRSCGALLAVVALFAPWSLAQDQPDDDLTKLNLEQLTKVQFYSASKHAQDVSETPASVTIITRAEIRTYGYRALADVLQAVRGYWVNSDRNYSYLGVRGFARPDAAAADCPRGGDVGGGGHAVCAQGAGHGGINIGCAFLNDA